MKNLIFSVLIASISSILFANENPYFTSIPITGIGENVLYQYMITVADPDNDTLILILNNKPDDLTYTEFGNDTALLSGILTNRFSDVSISVTDGTDTITQSFRIEVHCTNSGIPFTSEPFTNATIDSLYSYFIQTISIDNNIILSMDTVPGWLSFEFQYPNNAILSGTPSISDTGIYEIEIKAERESTLCPNTSRQIFNVQVIDNSVNTFQKKWPMKSFRIFPNPFINHLQIICDELIEAQSYVQIFNFNGCVVYSMELSTSANAINLDLEHLEPGHYYVRITNQNFTHSLKTIKQ